MRSPNPLITRRAALGLGAAGAAALLAACSGTAPGTASSGQPLSVVCTIFPAYDWCREILGDNPAGVQLTYLLQNGADLHSFQPSVADMAAVSSADLFVYVGGESEEWVEDALATAANPNQRAISLLEALGNNAAEEELVEGMQAEEEEGAGEDEAPELDEHVWLSLQNAQLFVSDIAQALGEIDPENADLYAENAAAYNAQLAELNDLYFMACVASSRSHIVFADRFPFRYLCRDYHLGYYAAFQGCSAETEASFDTIIFLAEKVDENNLPAVFVLENSDQRIAQTVVQNTQAKDQQILTLDSLQSTNRAQVSAGKTYLAAMEENLRTLAGVLGTSGVLKLKE